jgi:hypothetical protein
MSEIHKPGPNHGGFVVSDSMRTAIGEITDISRLRGQAHETANLFRDFHVGNGNGSGNIERELRQDLSSARGVLARWALMIAHQEFRTVDLSRIENGGDWDATRQTEEEIGQLGEQLYADGQIDGSVERHSPEARLCVQVDPTLLSGGGLVAVRRKRLMLTTQPVPRQFTDMRARHYGGRSPRGDELVADVHFEVDKVSEFALRLDEVEEVASARAAAKFRAILEGERPVEITDTATRSCLPGVVERAITTRHPMLAPATTVYYADAKYQNIRSADTDEPIVELVDA